MFKVGTSSPAEGHYKTTFMQGGKRKVCSHLLVLELQKFLQSAVHHQMAELLSLPPIRFLLARDSFQTLAIFFDVWGVQKVRRCVRESGWALLIWSFLALLLGSVVSSLRGWRRRCPLTLCGADSGLLTCLLLYTVYPLCYPRSNRSKPGFSLSAIIREHSVVLRRWEDIILGASISCSSCSVFVDQQAEVNESWSPPVIRISWNWNTHWATASSAAVPPQYRAASLLNHGPHIQQVQYLLYLYSSTEILFFFWHQKKR